jgi:hypothetical protein
VQPFKQAVKNKEALCYGRKRIPEMKKLLWVNQRKDSDFERQHGVCVPEQINECFTYLTDTKHRKKLVLTIVKCALCPLWCVCVCCMKADPHSGFTHAFRKVQSSRAEIWVGYFC